jgi:phosphoribosyl-AMP cyclohydrolase
MSAANNNEQEFGSTISPKWNNDGLITAVTIETKSNLVLMVAHVNELALQKTVKTGFAHYWSRSRNALWKKGESSGQVQKIDDIYVDCDQDAILYKVTIDENAATCHNGFKSCFYRKLDGINGDYKKAYLAIVDKPVADPEVLYGSKT